MIKKFRNALAISLLITLMPAVAYAHVIVTPNQAGVAQEQIFNVSVPNERQVPVTSVKLLIPHGVTDVIPTAQPGWTITVDATDSSQDSEITSVTWTGTIPVGQRQDFSFGAQLPGQATELDWKAYQTYADGTLVHWDQKPAGSDDASGNSGPYSVTKVVNDLSALTHPKNDSHTSLTGPYILAGLALLIALAALARPRTK